MLYMLVQDINDDDEIYFATIETSEDNPPIDNDGNGNDGSNPVVVRSIMPKSLLNHKNVFNKKWLN